MNDDDELPTLPDVDASLLTWLDDAPAIDELGRPLPPFVAAAGSAEPDGPDVGCGPAADLGGGRLRGILDDDHRPSNGQNQVMLRLHIAVRLLILVANLCEECNTWLMLIEGQQSSSKTQLRTH